LQTDDADVVAENNTPANARDYTGLHVQPRIDAEVAKESTQLLDGLPKLSAAHST
jgi:hypothetical protein